MATITVPPTTHSGRTAPAARVRVRSPLPWFLGLSALVHGVLIGWLWWPTEVPVYTPGGGATLAVTLQTVGPAPAAAPSPQPIRARHATPRPAPAPAPRPAPAATATPPSQAARVAATPAPAVPAPAPEAATPRQPAGTRSSAAHELAHARAQVGAGVRDALRAHFTYPLMARRRGWAGQVRLGLRVEPDGRLSHVRVLESSGYGLLDRAALASVRAIGVVPQALRWLHGHHFDMVLPVEYRLLDG